MNKHKMVVLLLLLMFFLGNINCVEAVELKGKIHKNVYIENIDCSGLTKNELKQKIYEVINENDGIEVFYGEKIYKIKLSDLNIHYKIDEMVEEAYNVGRDSNAISNLKTKVKLNMGETSVISLKYDCDVKSIENYISYIQKEIYKEPISATITIENDSISLERETYGLQVDSAKLKQILMKKADVIFYDREEIPVEVIKPPYVYEELSKIDTVLGSYETKFDKRVVGRVNNIYAASDATSNILINPYEEFSFNSFTNNKSFISRLKKAPVIKNGKLEEGLGGGICQVSTTIYNAALYAGLEITNIRNHSIPSSYIEKGRDATVSSGNLDLRFRNNFSTPILVYNKICDDKIISIIYGNKNDKKDVEIVTEVTETFPKKLKYIDSNKLYVGQREIQQRGRTGYKVNTFRIYKDKEGAKKELIFESYYPPMVEEILQGTKPNKIENKKSDEKIYDNKKSNQEKVPNNINNHKKIENLKNVEFEIM